MELEEEDVHIDLAVDRIAVGEAVHNLVVGSSAGVGIADDLCCHIAAVHSPVDVVGGIGLVVVHILHIAVVGGIVLEEASYNSVEGGIVLAEGDSGHNFVEEVVRTLPLALGNLDLDSQTCSKLLD